MSPFVKKLSRPLIYLCLICAFAYGGVRLYFLLTDGFHLDHIHSDFSFNPNWETRPLTAEEKETVHAILGQPFHYLGKGCQSYVFESADGAYVLKFFKYQRFRPKPWDDWFSFIPLVKTHRARKIEKKQRKLDRLFESWKIAFNLLSEETGLIYVHLNKTTHLQKHITLFDKIGAKHTLPIDEMEFLIQKKASMLCNTLADHMKNRDSAKAKRLIDALFSMVLSEYRRGIADGDHALMQNTGVLEEKPIHIDVGQFAFNQDVQNLVTAKQELFNKTYKFRLWLEKHHPELLVYVDQKLHSYIGDPFYSMRPTHLQKFH